MADEPGHRDRETDDADQGARANFRRVNLPIADLAKPEPVGKEVEGRGQDEKDRRAQEDDDRADSHGRIVSRPQVR